MRDFLPRTIFTEEHDMFRDMVRDFVAKDVKPHVAKWEEQAYIDRSFYKQAGELGLIGFAAPEKFGGSDMNDFRYNQILAEEFAQADCGSIIVGIGTINDLVVPYLRKFANEEQCERFLRPLTTGDAIAALAMTEPGAGSDLAGMRTTALPDGDDFILNGSKTFISNGMQADFTIVAAITDPDKGRAGVSLLIIEDGMEGYTKSGPLKKVGLHAQDTAELHFDNVRIPAANLIGERGAGFEYLRTNLAHERLSIAVGSVATSRRAFDLAYQHSMERTTFGKPLANHQVHGHFLAEMATDVQVAQSFVDQCVMAHNEEKLDEVGASMAKYWTTELQLEIVSRALQMHGGYGFMMEYPIATHYLDTRVQPIYGGPNEIMKEIISRKLSKGFGK
ncbi:acyl-CoA dehydrogenase family protein [Corynebacterium ulceribovis]|uniref:acyl-CoA dehydrogenase family protein n=1 Tax=Corynebacterium ulceribovis TaxID=487732 RepID=UPI000377BA41|nr:acyl-CoA dehydrogenase family protein [Corynebacterium ulceribovis]